MSKLCKWLCIVLLLSSCGTVRHVGKESRAFGRHLDSVEIGLAKGDTLNRSPHGNWQLRVTGAPFELGHKRGLLTQDLYQRQEAVFFKQVEHFVPKPKRQRFLLRFLKWYHRDILKDIPLPYRQELFALSQHASDDYDYLGSKYERNMLLHGAHDIGHTMQDLMLVGCSSIALWDAYTTNGDLIIGRNFDFYVNEDFSENKIVEFIIPEDGYRYASVSWPGMIGIVSGMNEKGLTVTLNAGKSSIPLKGKTPISIVARAILQQAQNIEEAIAVAKQFEVFISESILIGSDQDNRAVNIEISPKKFGVYEVDNGRLLCTNHFQSETYATDRRNQKHVQTSHSQYRLDKLSQSTSGQKKHDVNDVLTILRDLSGINRKDIGLGNEKSLNQLLAHHAVIFNPKERLMWVSNNPYQLGAFEAYNLNTIFEKSEELKAVAKLELPVDTLVESELFKNYRIFKTLESSIRHATDNKQTVSKEDLIQFESSNPMLWSTYRTLGNYYRAQKDWSKATKYYEIALSKEISTEQARQKIQKDLRKAKKKL